jgi:cytochrome d ubiquinol oxidase subunit II
VLSILGISLTPSQAPQIWHGLLNQALWAVLVTVLSRPRHGSRAVLQALQPGEDRHHCRNGAFLGTWGLAQLPYMVPPDLTVTNAASPPTTLREFFFSALVGMLVLIPSLCFLFHVFKMEDVEPPVHEKEVKEGV